MPRPTLFNNPKFRVASKRLGIPEPHLLGHLEYLWASANECGNPDFTCAESVEAAARWVGDDGVFADVLSRPGSNFLDVIDEGGFTIHDYWEHIPEYVPGRKRNEDNRKIVRTCEHCGMEYRSSRSNAKYCSASCRQLGYIDRKPTDTTTTNPVLTATSRQVDGTLTGIDARLTDVDGTPAPAPAHTPNNISSPNSNESGAEIIPEDWKTKPCPLRKLPKLQEAYPKLIAEILVHHPKAKFPDAGTKAEWMARQTFAQLARLDNFTEDEIINTLNWVLFKEQPNANGFSWREQFRSIAQLRDKKTGATVHKFGLMFEAAKRASPTETVKPAPLPGSEEELQERARRWWMNQAAKAAANG